MAKLSKEKCIELIIEQLQIGATWKDAFAVICGKSKLAENTFSSYWKIANERHREAQHAIKKATEVQSIEGELNKLKTLQLTKLDRMKIAESIAMGKAKRIEGQILVPSPSDQLKALDYLAKIDGDYAPTKLANTTASGDDVNQITISMPTGFILDFPSNTDESTT